MEENEKINEEQNQEKGQNLSFIRILLDGSFLTKRKVVRQIPFILLLSLFSAIYIGNRFHSERLVYRISKLQTEVKEMRSEAISIAAELMQLTRQSAIMNNIEKTDLKESLIPPKKIKIHN